MSNPDWPPTLRAPFRTDIPEPILVVPPPEDLTTQGTYIPASIRPRIRMPRDDPEFSHSSLLRVSIDPFRIRRWMLPSWGWVGVRTYYGHSDDEWETFQRRLFSAHWIMDGDEEQKFRIIWIEDRASLNGADEIVAREAFQAWFLEHSDPPNGINCLIPVIKKEWSGYEDKVFLMADKESIDSVLADSSDNLDETAFIKILARKYDEDHMRKWAPKLIGRYTGSFKVSPHYLPSLDGTFEKDAAYGQLGHASGWFLMAARTQDGVFREKNSRMVDEDFGKDPPNLGEDSSDEELDDEDDGDDGNSRDEL